MKWIVDFDPSAVKELDKLDPQQAKRILRFLFDRVAHLGDPRSIGPPVKEERFGGQVSQKKRFPLECLKF